MDKKSNILKFRPRTPLIEEVAQLGPIEDGVIEDVISSLRAEYTNAEIEAIKANLEQEDEFES